MSLPNEAWASDSLECSSRSSRLSARRRTARMFTVCGAHPPFRAAFLSLTSDILNRAWSKGSPSISTGIFSATDTVRYALRIIDRTAAAKNVHVASDLPEALYRYIGAGLQRLLQAFLNILVRLILNRPDGSWK